MIQIAFCDDDQTVLDQLSALLEGTGITLLDTRKTSPNNRIFEKYAVRVGGGNNHRYNLSDGVLLANLSRIIEISAFSKC